VFVDTPGLHDPQSTLSHYLVREAFRGLRGLDVLLYVIEPWGRVTDFDRRTLERLRDTHRPTILLVNKIDKARGNDLEETLLAYATMGQITELIPISATKRIGLDDAVATVVRYLPEGPPLFPPDIKCDRAEEFLIGEIIREKAFQLTYQELPYSIAVRVKWLRERDDRLVEIKAEIIVERESQKGIIVGKGGRMIRQIGSLARADIEILLGSRVFLELIAKVRPGWTRDEQHIRQLTESAQ
jgi:GTP-binding protein Era